MREGVSRKQVKLTLLVTSLLGLGLMAAIDEIIFHQILN